MIRVAVADDLEMIRTGFELIVGNETDMSIVASAANGVEIIEACRTRRVDVVLMDIRMPELDGLAAAKHILGEPDAPKIIILTTFGLDEYVSAAIAAGASGFLLKDASADELVASIRAVADGDAVLAPSLVQAVFEQARGAAKPRVVAGMDQLTERELEVLKSLAGGLSNAEIAERLFLSQATVKTHISRVLTKLGIRDRVQAVIAAYESGIVSLGD